MWAKEIARATLNLRDAGVPSPENDARELVEFVVGSRPGALDEPTPEQVAEFDAAVSRRANREPLQHIIGAMWFRYLELTSKPGAFVVRPETEMVVEAGLTALREMDVTNPIVVDLCTGSGAIALSIATEMAGAQVYAVELSPDAFAVASENNARYNDVVTLVNDDARTSLDELAGRVDLVITNPPYVPRSHDLTPEVLADPHMALFGGGDDGLDLPRELIARAHTLLRPGGILIMEHSDDQGQALREAARDFADVSTGQDLTGRDRWLYARRAHGDV